MTKVLFILKHREVLYTDEDGYGSYGTLQSGLWNSANFVCDMLLTQGFDSKIVHVLDNNCIDREVTQFKPDIVIIEALWVVPEKFEILQKLHPKIRWVIRNHSRIPFVANEGIAMEWFLKYAAYPNVSISSNAEDTNREVMHLISTAYPKLTHQELEKKCPYLPNYYPLDQKFSKIDRCDRRFKTVLDVGCFGAIRPLKNQLIQAIAAIKYANKVGKQLNFHINGTRLEQKGDPVLKNIRSLFDGINHQLVEHEWMPHEKFLALVSTMDIGLQCSYSETFNIVAADMVSQCVPVVASNQIDWISKWFHADPNNSDQIAVVMGRAWYYGYLTQYYDFNRNNLREYDTKSIACWDMEMKKLVIS